MEAFSLENVGMRFGALEVLRGISLKVQAGERRAILGPNGAGKTTLFHIMSSQLRPTSGRVRLFGEDVTGLAPHLLPARGLARTFQRNNLLLGLTVWENVRLAVQAGRGISRHLLRDVGSCADLAAETAALLAELGLTEVSGQPVSALSYGVQRQVEVAMALASKPRVLLLDEPTAGMSPAETQRTAELIARLPREITVLIIEHDMDVVDSLADWITVLHYGEVIADGPAAEVRRDPQVLAVYLGSAAGGEVPSHA